MSNDATNIISLDGHRGPGTYAEANENVICSKTTQGILESVVNPNTMEVIHHWPGLRERVRRLVKVG